MNIQDVVIWFFVIFAADLVAAMTVASIKHWRDKALSFGCDYCEKPKPLSRAPDKKHWFCRQCMEAFISEHREEFTVEQIASSVKGFRRRKRKKRV